MVRVTAGVEAHTHEYIATAHEDQKFGFSITSGDALEAVRRVLAADGLELLGLHSHIGSQIFDSSGFEVAARRVLALHARISDRARRRRCPRWTSAAASASPTPPRTTPSEPAQLATEMTQDRRARVPRAGHRGAAALDRARPRDRRARRCAPSTRSARSSRSRSTAAPCRTYVSVDGGMSDNIRTALYDADYSCTLASRGLRRARRCWPAWSASTARPATSWSRTSSCPATSSRATWSRCPGTGAYCRSMASNYNHALRPPVIAVRDGAARVVVRRETEDDLLATDVGDVT